MLKDAIDLNTLHRVLIIKLRHHGDVLLCSPVISALKSVAPHLEIDALVYRDTQDMLSQHPDIHSLWSIDREWKHFSLFRQCRVEWHCLRSLKRRSYDLIIHLTNHNRGAWLVRFLRPRYSVAPFQDKDTGFYKRLFYKNFTHLYPVIGGNRRHTVEIHLDALRRIGIYPDKKQRGLVLVYPNQAKIKIDSLLRQAKIIPKRFILIHPASRWFFKCWPVESMQQLISYLQQRNIPIVISGAPTEAEKDYIAKILPTHSAHLLNLQGQLSLKELAALIAQARLFIGVDSAPMHMAAAMQTPTIALFGPTGEVEWGPWQNMHHIILTAEQYRCRPCGKDGCGGGKVSECIETISVPQVIAAINELMMKKTHV